MNSPAENLKVYAGEVRYVDTSVGKTDEVGVGHDRAACAVVGELELDRLPRPVEGAALSDSPVLRTATAVD